jgi:pimeloyl-ACP methyl ester carboxylesterase
MRQPIFFAHANGFPSGSYGKLFDALMPEFEVAHLPQHGHDPQFPVDDNWRQLVDELLHHLARQPGPVWGVGHSLGGLLHLHAALRAPQHYRGVIMLDSPLLTFADRWVILAAKRLRFIDRITPAGRTLGRLAHFTDLRAARAYFSGKRLFRDFDPDCFEAYLQHGLQPGTDGLRLRFDPGTEIDIYRSVPHVHPGRLQQLQVPLALIQGNCSEIVRGYHVSAVRRLANAEHHAVNGGHMFPLERPLETTALLKSILGRWQRRLETHCA